MRIYYDDIESLRRVVHHVRVTVQKMPYFANVEFDEEQAVLRMLDFADVLEKCTNDKKFGIGGGASCNRTVDRNEPDGRERRLVLNGAHLD